MLRATYISRSALRILASMAACACFLFASSPAWALLCQQPSAGSDSAISSSLADQPGNLARAADAIATELKIAPARTAQACTKINPDECKWSLPEGQPQPAPEVSIRKTVVAYGPGAIAQAPRPAGERPISAQGSGPYDAFLARIFRPPRKT